MNYNKDDSIAVLAIIGMPALIFFSAVLNGWALSILWKWFIASTFEIRQITISQAIGISLIITYLTRSFSEKQEDKREHPFLSNVLTAFLKPLVSLGIGWIVTLFM